MKPAPQVTTARTRPVYGETFSAVPGRAVGARRRGQLKRDHTAAGFAQGPTYRDYRNAHRRHRRKDAQAISRYSSADNHNT